MEIRINELAYSYKHKTVFSKLNAEFMSGKLTAVLGENGSGKTTMLKLMTKILNPETGQIFLGESDFANLTVKDTAKVTGYVSQSYETPYLSVFEYLLIGRTPYQNLHYTKTDEEIVYNIIERTGLTKFEGRMITEMSGGERKKVVIARALVQQPKVLLLDEPTNNLDMKNQLDIMRIIKKEVTDRGVTAVLSVHDVNLAARFADMFILLKDGDVLDAGGREVVTAKKLSSIYGVPLKVYEQDGLPVITYAEQDGI